MSKIDVLVAEIGSTTTVINAFDQVRYGHPLLVGQGMAATTVEQGDVNAGLNNAIRDLKRKIGDGLAWGEIYASSSAAGGLKMTVHGLAYSMTAKAGNEAALGAGAVVRLVTAGVLNKYDLNKIEQIKPNIILLAGGVDHGESDTALTNAHLIAGKLTEMNHFPPVVYAGNKVVAEEVADIFSKHKIRCIITDNVYPEIDQLNVEPSRKIIQTVFEENICEAPGMAKIRQMVGGRIMPTPGAVMQAAKLLYQDIGDLMVIDVGGATTDVHSVTEAPFKTNTVVAGAEPKAKRTVEGDLGVYINASNVIALAGVEKIRASFGEEYQNLIRPIPDSPQGVRLMQHLTEVAVVTAVSRHAGVLKPLFGQSGGRSLLLGKDLTSIKWIIGTGGALTRLPGGKELLEKVKCAKDHQELRPSLCAIPVIDRNYIMASAGVLSLHYPEAALRLIKDSITADGEIPDEKPEV